MKSAKSSIFRRMGEAGLRGRGTDITGLLLLLVALISLLALFGDKAGIAGRLLESVMSVLVGIFRYVVPFALLLCAYAILRDKQSERTWRIAFGGVLTSLAFSGMALVNFTDSVIETFNIKEEEIVEKCLDDLTIKSEVRFDNLIDLIYNNYANKN